MDIRQHAQWQEVLDELKELNETLRQPSRQRTYRMYKWMHSYIVEDIATEETILLRTDLKTAVNAARDKGIDLREIVLDL